MNEKELLIIVTKYFKEKIFENHKINSLKTHSKLKSYKINPIVVKPVVHLGWSYKKVAQPVK